MKNATRVAAVAVGIASALAATAARSESAGGQDAEIALLKQQLRMLEQKLDKLQQQTTANTQATADANAKAAKANTTAKAADAKAVSVANANAALPVKGPVAKISLFSGDSGSTRGSSSCQR